MGIKSNLQKVISPLVCIHCGTEVDHSFQTTESPLFCCVGCKTVYQILKETGLSHYYELKKESLSIRTPQPVRLKKEKFDYLDDPEFIKNYSLDRSTIEFYLEGIHCVACLWLVEKLPDLVKGVRQSKLDLGKGIVTLQIDSDGSFAKAAEKLAQLGYQPHPIQKEEEIEKLQKKENHSHLIKLGVAAACTGNIMLLAVSLYGGASGKLAFLFRWISFFLFLPVLFYSAIPFYKSALGALKAKSLSIDLPIVLAIWIGSIASFISLITNSEHLYFDSLAALVFLLLSSRYFLRRMQQKVLSSSHLLHFISPSRAKRLNLKLDIFEEVPVESLKKGDILQIGEGELIPVDGTLLKKTASINSAVLTGESIPEKCHPGEPVYAGCTNEGNSIEIEVHAIKNETRLGKILKEIESGNFKKAPLVAFADRLSKWFIFLVLVVAPLVFLFYAPQSIHLGFTRALALIIVTCPCALALATPLAISITLGKTAREGILIKGSEVLERIYQANNVILDKTGTLTEGNFEVLNWIGEVKQGESIRAAVVALESKSKHPIAKSLIRFLKPKLNQPIPEVKNYQEVLGEGVSGEIENHHYEIKSLRSKNISFLTLETEIGGWRDHHLVARAKLGDKIRPDSKSAVDELKKINLSPFILSGDRKEIVDEVGKELQIPVSDRISEANPERKKEFVQSFAKAIMVGDGANDASALSSAYVGIAVHQGAEVSLRAADVYLSSVGVTPVAELIQISKETFKVIYRNFYFSLFYNVAGGLCAVLGFVNPLFAALLMPLSSLTVFISSVFGTKKLRSFGKVKA